ncbi:hypothetical protein [Pseudomonas indica]|jgi:hypothetical protein|uniref:hypothetical protein n=1 Tax=Pseudomonas indica TaxID=137658 RepID=UPI0023F9FF1F|nr:hypothetical protein [Pseudomonas indica]MBU3057972.1 hypothetical protein [Pseudomonas indica]
MGRQLPQISFYVTGLRKNKNETLIIGRPPCARTGHELSSSLWFFLHSGLPAGIPVWLPRSIARMKILGFQLIMGDYLARSVRGISCAPPLTRH